MFSPRMNVGDRVEEGGVRATVLFVGKIEGVEGEWLGVDWDDPSRGKHDGSHKGKRYFTARHKTSGSFIRVEKVNKGTTLMEAVQFRYGEESDPKDFTGHIVGKKEIEFVGMRQIESRQCDFSKLTALIVDDMQISKCGDQEELKKRFLSCVDLDLTLNLVSSWTTVFELIQSFPHLKSIVLNRNYLKRLVCGMVDGFQFPRMRTLILNECRLQWDQMTQLLPIFPNLEELGFCKNEATVLEVPSGCLERLKLLDLEGNPLNSWTEVLKLAHLPALYSLNLNGTRLTTIDFPTDMEKPFRNLTILYLCENNISQWPMVDELARVPSLKHLLIRDNPIIRNADSHQTGRQMVIAKIPTLEILDREYIEPKERRGAEIDYLKMFGKQWVEAGGKYDSKEFGVIAEDFKKTHPRYISLVKKFGSPEESELGTHVKSSSGLLGNRLVEVNVICDPIVAAKRIPTSMTVQKLKIVIGRLCKRDPRSVSLQYQSQAMPGIKIPLDNDFRQLAFYDLSDGDTIFVQ